MKQMLKTRRGQVHLLALMADAEGSGENRVFAALAKRADDPWLVRVSARHAADEAGHAELLEQRIATLQAHRPRLPPELDILGNLDRALGGAMSKPVVDELDVMRAYGVLQVIEERAISQLPLFIESFAHVDEESVAVFKVLLRDESRHLRYCHAMTRRYAPSASVLSQWLAHVREVEAKVFADGTMANLKYVLDARLLEVPWWARALWRTLSLIGAIATPPRTTGFA